MNRKLLILCIATVGCAFGQYGGPSVLSRGNSMAGEGSRLPLGFQFSAGVNAVYDSDLVPVSVDSKGKLATVGGLYGVEGNLGLAGVKRWSHSSIGLTYDGNYRHYTQNTYWNGSDHIVGLDGQWALSRRVMFSSRNTGGTTARSYGEFGQYVSGPDSLLAVSQNNIFDNRMYYIQTSDEVTIQKTARLSYAFGGDGFAVRRQSKALIGVNGYGAHSSLAYRLDKLQTVDVAYSYLHFDYPRAFGESTIHQVTGGYSRMLSRNWTLSLLGGAYRIDTTGVTQVALDPATAALFGQGVIVQAFNRVTTLPAVQASLSGKLRRTQISFNYNRGVNPGNGVYLTSTIETAGASVTYQGTSRLSFGASGGYSSMSSVGQQNLGQYSSFTGGFSTSYRIARSLHFDGHADFRQSQIDVTNGFSRLGSRIAIGLKYSPGEKPLVLFR